MAVSGIVLTKLDGTAKGGVILGIADQLGIPVRYIGVGERVEDLREFDPEEFVEALFEGARTACQRLRDRAHADARRAKERSLRARPVRRFLLIRKRRTDATLPAPSPLALQASEI